MLHTWLSLMLGAELEAFTSLAARRALRSAALGCAQLASLEKSIARKREIGRLYPRLLKGVKGLLLPPDALGDERNIYWVYGIVLDKSVGVEAEFVQKKLGEKKIGTRPFFWCMHEQPVLLAMGHCKNVSCPVGENLARRGFYVPSGLGLTDSQIRRVAMELCTIMEALPDAEPAPQGPDGTDFPPL